MSIKIKRDERQVFTGGSFVMTITDNFILQTERTYRKPIK